MYPGDGPDLVKRRTDLPQPDVGAPVPLLVSHEFCAVLAYCIGGDYQEVSPDTPEVRESTALVRFEGLEALTFGPPNDEAFEGHPLARKGLEPYGVFEIQNSSWIARLEEMNRVHEHHDPAHFAELVHYVFAFHDSTYECAALRVESLGTRMLTLGERPAELAPLLRIATP